MIKSKRYFSFLFFGIVAIVLVIREIVIHNKLNENMRFTIGTITRISSSVDGGPMADYTYLFNEKIYSGIFTISPNDKVVPKKSHRFLVKFNFKEPNISFPMIDQKIPTDAAAPDSGWVQIPDFSH